MKASAGRIYCKHSALLLLRALARPGAVLCGHRDVLLTGGPGISLSARFSLQTGEGGPDNDTFRVGSLVVEGRQRESGS